MSNAVDHGIFDVASALEVPVLVAALGALALVLFHVGAFAVELRARRRRSMRTIERVADEARDVVGDRDRLRGVLAPAAWSAAMRATLEVFADNAGTANAEPRLAKALADFDYDAQGRLARTRLLVRVGPALGLMGTLIPLSPALDGLARGDVDRLSNDLREAFSVTVVGLLIGAVAFTISLYRDRMYGQDLSDLEYVAAVLTAPDLIPAAQQPAAPAPAVPAPTAVPLTPAASPLAFPEQP